MTRSTAPTFEERNRVASIADPARTGYVSTIHGDGSVSVLWDGWAHPVIVSPGKIAHAPLARPEAGAR